MDDAASPTPPAQERRSIPRGQLAIVAARQLLQRVHVDVVGQGDHMTVGKEELTHARMPAAELAMERAGGIVGPLAEVPFRLAGDAREVAREIAIPDRAFAPGRAALPPVAPGGMFLADQDRGTGA